MNSQHAQTNIKGNCVHTNRFLTLVFKISDIQIQIRLRFSLKDPIHTEYTITHLRLKIQGKSYLY